MPGINYIRLTVTEVQKGICPCCVGGDVARVLGSDADCVCGLFVKRLKKHQKGLPLYHTCIRDLPGRGRLTIYMVQPGLLQVDLALQGFPSHREMVDLDTLLSGLGAWVTATYTDYGYTQEELTRPVEEVYSGPPLVEQGLVTPEVDERLARAIAEGPPWAQEQELKDGRRPRPTPPPLVGHR